LLARATALVCRLDLRFDRFAFPASCHASLYVAVGLANQCSWLVSARRRWPAGCCSYVTLERKRRTPLAFIAFEGADLLPAMRARHHASAQSQRITRRLIRRRKVMFYTSSYQLHVSHLPNLTGPFICGHLKSVANIEPPAGITERAPTGTIGNPAQQRSKLPDCRVEICTPLC
jgi:hypothetical protein